MAVNIGPKIGIDGEAEYRRQINNIIQQAKTLDSEMRAVAAAFTESTSAQDKNAAKSKILNQQIDVQKQRVEELSAMLAKSAEKYGENDTRTLKWKEAVNNANAELSKMENELRDGGEALDDNAEKALTFGDVIKANVISDAIMSGLRKMGDLIADAGRKLVDVTKDAIAGYAEQEQLIGGVETLFAESSDAVQAYADNAYKTAGMNANEYMSTVTSFSASLLQGLGGDTAAAAKLADRAITDMSDNANKMGTDISTIQNAYQGFAKQNYTLLDNLKLGYGGTQAEMARLINESGVLGDEIEVTANTVNNVSFDKIIEAIGVVQDRMGITGTTAKEAGATIEGSMNAASSAWQNLITGLGGEQENLDTLVNNFVESAAVAAENLLPRITQILSGLGSMISALAPVIAEELPKIITDTLPGMIDAGGEIIEALLEGVVDMLPEVAAAAVPIVMDLAEAIIDSLPAIVDAGVTLIGELIGGIGKALPDLIPAAVEAVLTMVDGLIDNIGMLIDAALELILGLAEGLIKALPELVRRIPEIIEKLVSGLLDHLDELITAGIELILALAVGLVEAIPELIASIPKIIKAIIDAFANTDWGEIGRNIIDGIGEGLTRFVRNLKDAVKRVANSVVGWAKDLLGISSPSKVFADEVGKMIPAGITVGIDKSMPKAIRDIQTQFNAIANVPVPTIAAAGGGATTNYGGVTIQVYGAPGQDVNALADIVMERMQGAVRRKEAVFA